MLLIRTRTGIACLLLVQGLAACGGPTGLPSAPSAPETGTPGSPTPGAGASVLADATLSGRVYETVSPGTTAGIPAVDVYCEQCGEESHSWTTTDANGEYVFPHGVWTEGRPWFPVRIFVHKDGYTDPPGVPHTTFPNPSDPGWREVVVSGDTRFEIELVRQ
jgi:hypothetical protein